MDLKTPWQNYTDKRNEPKQMSLNDFIDLVHEIKNGCIRIKRGKQKFVQGSLRYATITSLLYLTGCRLGEFFCPSETTKTYSYFDKESKETKTVEKTYSYDPNEGIKIGDLAIDPSDEHLKPGQAQWLTLKLLVRKRREEKPYYRVVEVARVDDEADPYFPLIKIIQEYLFRLGLTDPSKLALHKDKKLFPLTYATVTNRLSREYQINPHFIRHLRASHLMKYHGYTVADLKKFFEWKSATMPLRYATSDRSTLKERLLKFV